MELTKIKDNIFSHLFPLEVWYEILCVCLSCVHNLKHIQSSRKEQMFLIYMVAGLRINFY